jgi:WD40 repeat protein
LTLLGNGDMVSGSYDNTIKIWNTEDGTVTRILTGHKNLISALKILKNGDLVSSSPDCTIKIWDVENGTIKKNITENAAVYPLEQLENGYLVSGTYADESGPINIWE